MGQQTDIEVRVKNFGSTDLKDVGMSFFLNGQGNIIPSIQIPTLPANQERPHKVSVSFPELPPTAFDDLKKQTNDERVAQRKPEMNADEERN